LVPPDDAVQHSVVFTTLFQFQCRGIVPARQPRAGKPDGEAGSKIEYGKGPPSKFEPSKIEVGL